MSLVQPHTVGTGVRKPSPHERLSRAPALIALSDRVNSLDDEHVILRYVVDGLVDIFQATAGLLMVCGSTMYSRFRGSSDSLQRLEERLHLLQVEGKPFIDPETLSSLEFRKQLLIVPVRWQDKAIGVLGFDIGRRRIVTSERGMIHLLANQIAAKFSSRQQPPESSPTGVAMQGSLKAAVAVQQSLLPSIPPTRTCGLSIATFTQPAELVGGDYYDLICVDQNKMGIVIADVQGKGISAALFGNLLRTTTHFLTRETPSPAALLGKINMILHRKAASSRKLFTMFYAIFDARTNVLTYSGSGHVNPVLLSRSAPAIRRLSSDGTLLGISPGQRFSEHSVQLLPGDIAVYFTDGVIEHRNSAGQMFGEERLTRRIVELREKDPETIVNAVKADLGHFAPLPSSDDVTIVVTKVPETTNDLGS